MEEATDYRLGTSKLFRKKKGRLTREEALEARPVRNLKAKASFDAQGELVLEIERRRDWFGRLLGLMVAAPLHKRLSLDEMGTFVWNLCDGKRSVKQIASLLGSRYRLNRREAVISLTTFLRSLGKRGLIGFALTKENADGEASA